MKYEIPEKHGLSVKALGNLVFHEEGNPALSDIQYEALEAGVGRGESILVVSPTSTGKTQIALWAIATALDEGHNCVYLVTHRALAKQKFDDFKQILLDKYLEGNVTDLVIATGDYIENAEGENATEPLSSRILVATYEKYLAMLSASGIPEDMSKTVVICDEIQLIGDEHRGQSVEVLLTLIKRAGWRQFVGLSAVLEYQDATDLANWLNVNLVTSLTREKHLRYECWTPKGIVAVTSEHPENIEEDIPWPEKTKPTVLDILTYLLKLKNPPTPIVVFCMKKQDTYDLAKEFIEKYVAKKKNQLTFEFDQIPATAANVLLSETLSVRIGIHNADLLDEERHIVEKLLLDNKIDVIFATSTLAAGVNFPLGAAVFADWERWNSKRRVYEPIGTDEFHNMAGRVGRMGFEHGEGLVTFIASSLSDLRNARQYLNLSSLPALKSRINPERFNLLILQLITSGLCTCAEDVLEIVFNTFSALREQDRNPQKFEKWGHILSVAFDELIQNGYILQNKSGRIVPTPVGKAISYSGLLPDTATFLLNYISEHYVKLVTLLPTFDNAGDVYQLSFLFFSACYSSPEFRQFNKKQPTRILYWPLEKRPLIDADCYKNSLPDPIWQADVSPINAAFLACGWIDGEELLKLEASLPQLSAGMLREMVRNLTWVLQGYASIVDAAVDITVPEICRPKAFRDPDVNLPLISKLPRILRRLSYRLAEGLPDDVLWMRSLHAPDSSFSMFRDEILQLRKLGWTKPEQIMLGTKEADAARNAAFSKSKPSPQAKSNWLRGASREWKKMQRKRSSERHLKRAKHCPSVGLVSEYYDKKGVEFEKVFEKILKTLGVKYFRLDDKTKTGAPDYIVEFLDSPALIFELKTKENDKLVDYNGAVEVLSASEIHGHKHSFCVTLCNPGIDPSVPLVIASCGRLSVVECSDLGEALLRLCEGSLTQNQAWKWLATPGQALVADLPYREYA